MKHLGIDDKDEKDLYRGKRNWGGVKDFFARKLPELAEIRDNSRNGSGKERLLAAVVDEVIDSLHRQLSEMKLFSEIPVVPNAEGTEDMPSPNYSKMELAPVTNLGCESELARLDNRIKVSGGTESVMSMSRKNIIATNGLLVDSAFMEMTREETKERFKWARKSEQTLAVRKLEKDFILTVRASKGLVLRKREDLKKKKNTRLLNTLQTCKEHKGPLTPDSLDY